MSTNSSPLKNVILRSGRVVDREAIRIPRRRRRALKFSEVEDTILRTPPQEEDMEEDHVPLPPPRVDEVIDPPARRMREYTLLHVV